MPYCKEDVEDIDAIAWARLVSDFSKAIDILQKVHTNPNFYLSYNNRKLLKRVLENLEKCEEYVV